MTDTEVYVGGVDENQTPSNLRTVSAAALPAVEVKVEKANRKAKRLGLDARLTLTVVERRTVKVPSDLPEPLWGETVVVDHRITGDTIALPGGWTFLAALDHTTPGINVVRRNPNLADDVQVPTWARTAEPGCDHCRADRRRNDTYLVTNEAGDVQQVGSSCLVDFLGLTPAQVGWIFEGVDSEGGESDGGVRVAETLPTAYFLTVVATLIRTEGWVSRKTAEMFERKTATADLAFMVFTASDAWSKKEAQRIFNSATPADEKNAADAIAWLASDEFDIDGDYGWNLRAAASGPGITFRNTGIAASLVFCWLRKSEQMAERKAKAAASTSVHLGTVGQKVLIPVIVTGTRSFDGDYGTRLLVKAVTPDGSEVTAWTTPHTKFGAWAQDVAGDGNTYAVKGTVKDHGEFNGVAQTTLTRAGVA